MVYRGIYLITLSDGGCYSIFAYVTPINIIYPDVKREYVIPCDRNIGNKFIQMVHNVTSKVDFCAISNLRNAHKLFSHLKVYYIDCNPAYTQPTDKHTCIVWLHTFSQPQHICRDETNVYRKCMSRNQRHTSGGRFVE